MIEILRRDKILCAKNVIEFFDKIEIGAPAEKIIEYSHRWHFVITMGSKRSGLRAKYYLRSVANEVLKNSPVPVLIVK
ncbi:universal stress protein [Candidatus Nitrosotenuis aquarius]|uniref:universal stress protein n=1 Tax=Candidatus Nitrosotenuis aquarius TaxID=1846278 RepID=UPI000C1E4285|nr:universal stress protein [Candidatus Nitrosotenuis aquarius]